MHKTITLSVCKIPVLLLASLCLLVGCIAPKAVGPDIDDTALKHEQQFQYRLWLENYVAQSARLNDVGWNILAAGVPFCTKLGYSSGVSLIDMNVLDKKYHSAANGLYGVAAYPKVVGIATGSGAHAAGLKLGDTIIGVGGDTISADDSHKIRDYVDESRVSYQLDILRAGKRYQVTWKAPDICDYTLQLSQQDTINAYADGERIVIYTGMMDFATQDHELALVLAHELAHNIRGHIDAKRANAIGGLLLGTIVDAMLGSGNNFGRLGQSIGAEVHSVDFEREADYVSLYIMTYSPYDIDHAPNFWRRMALKNGGKSIDFSSTHPTSAARMLALDTIIEEIKQKRAAGLPLVPDEQP